MPYIAGIATATPDHIVTQSEAKRFAAELFGDSASVLLTVFDNAQIDERHSVQALDWYADEHDFTEVNDRYIEHALDLSEQVVCGVADQLGIRTEDFDAIFFVSTTGLSTPSIDARLFTRVSLNPHLKRIPIWGLGCAAGVGAIARASEYVRAFPKHRALVVSVELCSLAFQLSDRSKANVIASALFGDGAAACVICGDEVPRSQQVWAQPSIVRSLSTLYPDTLDVMGWRITGKGFNIVLSRDIPSIVTSLVKENIEELLSEDGLGIHDIALYATHPGGVKVMQAYEKALCLHDGELKHSYDVLLKFGNMSSATVFFILRRVLEESKGSKNCYGLTSALGPGFSSELVLLKWE